MAEELIFLALLSEFWDLRYVERVKNAVTAGKITEAEADVLIEDAGLDGQW